MMDASEARDFPARAREALRNETLQDALGGLPGGLVAQRAAAKARVPEFEAMREAARDIRDHTLEHLEAYLDAFIAKAEAQGTIVHRAATAADARAIVLEICREAGAKLVAKGKSMISEEIGLNAHLEGAGLRVVETDLGEYIVQMRGERPSHIIAPAIHLTQADVERDFRAKHRQFAEDRDLSTAPLLVGEARELLRETFLGADIGITGANFLVAETGSMVLVTNEGNGDLTSLLPRVHVAVASIEKVVPTLSDLSTLLRVLARSSTGQDLTAYTTLITGPKRAHDPCGPEAHHIVIVDNGRRALLTSRFKSALRCIRCGACSNHCPVYGVVGGHAYGSVYSGPIGAVLSPALAGIDATAHLPHASTLCGRCEEVCPVKIPLPGLLRAWREESFAAAPGFFAKRLLRAWGFVAARPRLYQPVSRLLVAILGALGRTRGVLRWLPFSGWTVTRDFPAPQGRTFQQLYAEGGEERSS